MQDKPKRPSVPWSQRSPESEASKASRRVRRAAHTAANVEFVTQMKLSLGCVDCGYKEHAAALDFDHLPGTEKRRAISRMVQCTRTVLLAEIAKCELVCSNCHRIRTWRRKQEAASQAASLLGDRELNRTEAQAELPGITSCC